MNIMKILMVFGLVAGVHHFEDLCHGIVEENNLWISTDVKNTGITESQFNEVIDRAIEIYDPIITDLGANLVVERKWDDGTVNAYARQSGSTWYVSMFGGLARHETVTQDGFALVICHEIGHHIGGAPKYKDWFGKPDWASNEGQADYFAGLKCLRKFFAEDDNVEYMSNFEVPQIVKEQCSSEHTSLEEQAICERTAMAGQSVAYLFQALRNQDEAPRFDTPDTNEVSKTKDSHPATQCRMDTYFNGGVCRASVLDDVDQADYRIGSCTREAGNELGNRPLCWFKPDTI